MPLPRVLVIDDIYAAAIDRRNRDRESFCFRTGIVDVTGDISAEELKKPVAEGVFCSGQILENGKIENDLVGTLDLIRKGFTPASRWSLILLDLHFKTGTVRGGEAVGRDEDRDPRSYFGLEILRTIRREPQLNDLPVIILSSLDRAEVESVFSGLSALDFCDKSLLDRTKMQLLLHENGLIEDEVIVGRSLPLLKCLREARSRAGHGNDNILIVGESGTGKELLANYIHRSSNREGAYVPFFTQGVPETLIEDRLFGHEKGAFAGAAASMPGAAESADKGTLFVDEFGDISFSVQAKLLRLLDINIREVQRIGAATPKTLDIQIVMATNRLAALQGDEFRSDLLYRVKSDDPIVLPPLRERREDIPQLVEFFLRRFEARFGTEKRTVPEETMNLLLAHDWPGNIRDLERVIEHAVLNHKGLRLLLPQHLKLGKAIPPIPKQALPEQLTSQPTTPDAAEGTKADDLQGLLRVLKAFPYEQLKPADVVGSYGPAREAMARCLAGLLRRALVLTSRPTPEKPSGEIYYTPAIHLLVGVPEQEKKKWSSPKCADLVRQIISATDDLKDEFLSDEVLRAAYEAASRLRQRK